MTQAEIENVVVRGGPRIHTAEPQTGSVAPRAVVDSFSSALREFLVAEGYQASDYSPKADNQESTLPRNTGDVVPPIQAFGYSKSKVEPRHEPVIVDDGGTVIKYDDGFEGTLKITVRDPEGENKELIGKIETIFEKHGLAAMEFCGPPTQPTILPSVCYWLRRE